MKVRHAFIRFLPVLLLLLLALPLVGVGSGGSLEVELHLAGVHEGVLAGRPARGVSPVAEVDALVDTRLLQVGERQDGVRETKPGRGGA